MKELLSKLGVRLKNKKVLLALASGIVLTLLNAGFITLDQSNQVNEIVNVVLSVLVGIGVLGNPESHVQE